MQEEKETKNGFARLHMDEATAEGRVELTAKTVWKENNPQSGVFTKTKLMPFLKSLRRDDYDHTANFFKLLRERLRLSNSLKHRFDRGGNGYFWASFSRPMGTEGAKIMVHPELLKLAELYVNGKVFIDFDMDDLIDEGLQTD